MDDRNPRSAPKPPWTEREDELLMEHYGKMTVARLREKYLQKRSVQAIRARFSKLNAAGPRRKWSERETETLVANWTVKSRREILELLPGKTWSQCSGRIGTLRKEGRAVPDRRGVEHPMDREIYDLVMSRFGDVSIDSDPVLPQSALRARSSTGVPGVVYTASTGLYAAYIMRDGKDFHLGRFRDFSMAVALKCVAERRPDEVVRLISERRADKP